MGYYISFKILEYEIKSKIEGGIKSATFECALTEIVIDEDGAKNIEWIEEGKEMNYKGQFYDIVKMSMVLKQITYYCINDEEEEALFAALNDHIKTNIIDSWSLKNNSSKKIIDQVKFYFSQGDIGLYNHQSLNKVFLSVNLIYSPAFIEIDSPPPEFV